MKYAWLLLAACGSSPPPKPVVSNKPVIESTTCKDASVVLRGPITVEDPKAGPAREDAILRACTDDHWSPQALACIGSSKTPRDCLLDKLTGQQQDNYLAKLGTWEAQYAAADDDPAPPSADKYTDCSDLVIDTSKYAPPFDTERAWQLPRRAKLIEDQCRNDGWSEETKTCLLAARDIAGTSACIQQDIQLASLTKKLADLDATAQKIGAAKKKPATITCAKAVATHYADAKWKTPTKDKQTSRTQMQKACTAENWSEDQRACIVAADAPSCYASPLLWSYPALTLVKKPNVPDECAIYLAMIKQIIVCPAVPEPSRAAMKDGFSSVEAAWANMTPDEGAAMATGCKAGADAMMSAFPSCNGW